MPTQETLSQAVFAKRAIVFDLFHTLTAKESTLKPFPMTSDFLGFSRDKWNQQLLEKSKDRLTGKTKDPFVFMRQMVQAINPAIPAPLIDQSTKNLIAWFRACLLGIPDSTKETLIELRRRGKRIGDRKSVV
jgi:hypothetical protein